MSKRARGHAPRDRKRPIAFPKPPCSPKLPFPPPAQRPSDPGCSTGTGWKQLKKILKGHR